MAAEGVKNDPRPSDVPSTERISIAHRIPAEWLDRLLVAHCAIRAGTPVEDAAVHLLGVARELLDDAALGVCILRADGAPITIHLAPTRASHPVETDPARLFPEFGFERIVPIRVDEGSTLHAASDDEFRFVEGAPAAFLLERLAQMLGSVFEHHRGRRDLDAQVIQSSKLASLGQIAAGIVHELNNPLTTIVAYSDFLRKKTVQRGGDAADVERLARINEAAERILRFSRDLTAYARPADERPEPVSIHDVIERALLFCEHEIEQTRVQVARRFGVVAAVRGVGSQLTQVFVNLFTNAAHAMRAQGGTLDIATAMTEEYVEIVVTDDGHGIDADNLPRIFEPFFTTKTDGTGTGLGLSIVRKIVQNHGGRIRVDVNAPRGTVFYVDLPLLPRRDE
jgi:signal transduction histidine kinase